MNQILQETKRNQQMANQIAYRTFTTHALDQGALPVGQEVRRLVNCSHLSTFLFGENVIFPCKNKKKGRKQTKWAGIHQSQATNAPPFKRLIPETSATIRQRKRNRWFSSELLNWRLFRNLSRDIGDGVENVQELNSWGRRSSSDFFIGLLQSLQTMHITHI